MTEITTVTQFRMRPELQRVRYIASVILILFSLGMIGYLIFRREESFFEYLIWIVGVGLWIYLSWTTLTTRLQISATGIDYFAGREHIQSTWEEIGALQYLVNGPTLFVGGDPIQPTGRNRRDPRPKIPLYLFMARWANMQDWQADPLGREIVTYLPAFFVSSQGETP